MVLRVETFKAQKKANEDMRKAEKAMNAVTEMVCSMEDDMIKEEQILALRADELRRQSVDIFKVRIARFTIVSKITVHPIKVAFAVSRLLP